MPIIYAKWHVCKENLTKTVVNVCKSVIHGWIDSTKSSNKEILTKVELFWSVATLSLHRKECSTKKPVQKPNLKSKTTLICWTICLMKKSTSAQKGNDLSSVFLSLIGKKRLMHNHSLKIYPILWSIKDIHGLLPNSITHCSRRSFHLHTLTINLLPLTRLNRSSFSFSWCFCFVFPQICVC